MFDWLGIKIGFYHLCIIRINGAPDFFLPQLQKLQSSLHTLIIFVYAELRGVSVFHWSHPWRPAGLRTPCLWP